jgi:hypothetical protein
MHSTNSTFGVSIWNQDQAAINAYFRGLTADSIKGFLESLMECTSFQCCHQQSERNVPCLKFSNSIINYKNLHAHKTMGVILLADYDCIPHSFYILPMLPGTQNRQVQEMITHLLQEV